MSRPEADIDSQNKIAEILSICRAIAANAEDCGDYQTGLYRYRDSAVQITADHDSKRTGYECMIHVFGTPIKDEDTWVVPVIHYILDSQGVFTREMEVEDDQSIIQNVLSERVRELIDFAPRRHLPKELFEIAERDIERLAGHMSTADIMRAMLGRPLPKSLSQEAGNRDVTWTEIDELLLVLKDIQANPRIAE